MLNKQICMKCVEENLFAWNNIDEEDWGNGVLYCPVYFPCIEDVSKGPPDDCLYLVEQFLYHDLTETKINAK